MYAHNTHRYSTAKTTRSATIPVSVKSTRQTRNRHSLPVPLPAPASLFLLIIGTQRRPTYTYAAYPIIPNVIGTMNLRTIHGCFRFCLLSRAATAASSTTPQHFPWAIVVRRLGGEQAPRRFSRKKLAKSGKHLSVTWSNFFLLIKLTLHRHRSSSFYDAFLLCSTSNTHWPYNFTVEQRFVAKNNSLNTCSCRFQEKAIDFPKDTPGDCVGIYKWSQFWASYWRWTRVK